MPEGNQRASLRDVLNYDPEVYITPDEMALIKDTFKDNPKLLGVLRKVMLPTLLDPQLPLEEMANDAFLAGLDFAAMPADEVKPIVLARQDAIKFIIGGLIKLKVFAASKEESPYQAELRKKKDSNK